MHKRRRLVTRYVSGGQLLDVGCGAGHFLDEMRGARGWQVRGVEPSAGAAQAAQDRGLDVYPGDLAAAGFPDGAFDAVTLWDVVEHLHDPQAVLSEVRRILRPGGALVLRTPSVDSLDARVFGSYWAGLDSPRHIAVFSCRTLARLLAAAGFRLDSLATGSGSFGVWHLSLRFLLDERIHRPGLRRALLQATGSPIARAVTLPAFYLIDRFGRGSELLVVARPDLEAGKRESR